ncbi:MAG: NAD+ synthase, partial [Candidatus Dormibacteria bacterium]
MSQLDINSQLVAGILRSFIADEVLKVGAKGVVVAVSGGVDSALAARLAVEALGPQAVTAAALPYRLSDPQSLKDAQLLAQELGLELLVRDISPQIDAYFAELPAA